MLLLLLGSLEITRWKRKKEMISDPKPEEVDKQRKKERMKTQPNTKYSLKSPI
jgi:hypothetical protein